LAGGRIRIPGTAPHRRPSFATDVRFGRRRRHEIAVDADRAFDDSAKNAGAEADEPETYPYGERQYSVIDPGGHAWTFSQSVTDVDPASWGGVLNESAT
jgi:hypothetical protein